MIFSTGWRSELNGRQRLTPFNDHWLVTLNWLNDGPADESADAVAPRALDEEAVYETIRPLVRCDGTSGAKLAYWKRTPNLWRT